jgi:hypothetical protein
VPPLLGVWISEFGIFQDLEILEFPAATGIRAPLKTLFHREGCEGREDGDAVLMAFN